MNYYEILRDGPLCYEHAEFVFQEYLRSVSEATMMNTYLGLMHALDVARGWERWLPKAIVLRNIEVKRQELMSDVAAIKGTK